MRIEEASTITSIEVTASGAEGPLTFYFFDCKLEIKKGGETRDHVQKNGWRVHKKLFHLSRVAPRIQDLQIAPISHGTSLEVSRLESHLFEPPRQPHSRSLIP